jgi:hypothetical protein
MSIVKLEGVFVSFKETLGEVNVFFPRLIHDIFLSFLFQIYS